MKTLLRPLRFFVGLGSLAAGLSAQTPAMPERVAVAGVLAFGRVPTGVEASTTGVAIADLLMQHRKTLRTDQGLRAAVARQAERDAFGTVGAATPQTAPSGDEIYVEQLAGHVRWLAAHPDDYAATIERAYRLVLQRAAYAGEHTYWRRQPALPFVLLVGCIEDWARRNSPGLTETGGPAAISVNSRFLTTVRLSPTVATEAREAAHLVPADANLALAAGRNVIGAGAETVLSVGAVHFAVAGLKRDD